MSRTAFVPVVILLVCVVPIAGAAEYVRDLWKRGALVIYLSGRNAEAMLDGTTTSLQRWGFPLGVRGAQLILKPRFDEPDETFKQASLDHITALGQVVGSFENEPGNLAAMALRWPDAAVVFLDTDFNPGGAVKTPPASARWVGDYADYTPPPAAPRRRCPRRLVAAPSLTRAAAAFGLTRAAWARSRLAEVPATVGGTPPPAFVVADT